MSCAHSRQPRATPETCSMCLGVVVERLPSRFVPWADDGLALFDEVSVDLAVLRITNEKRSALKCERRRPRVGRPRVGRPRVSR